MMCRLQRFVPSIAKSVSMSVPAQRISLAAVVTAARAGALDHASALFDRGGHGARRDDPAALAVHGRLLKDRALRAAGSERATLFVSAEDHYAAADALQPQPYTRINVATLALLSGDVERACAIASHLLGWLDDATGIAETPYYIAATRAEAHLICGDRQAAEAALQAAYRHDPDGWSDHASTIRQLGLVLGATHADSDWLDAYRPPRSLYFAGHLGVAETGSEHLVAAIDDILERERIGFAYGALAAGSDIVIAERVLAHGGELHVVLPTRADAFVDQSITPFGAGWRTRFDECLAAANSVRMTACVIGDYEPLATQLAADVAMGSAVLDARLHESEAVQLVVLDDGAGPFGAGSGTARDAAAWHATARRQHCITWPRNAPVAASASKREGRPDRRLAAMLHIAIDRLDILDEAEFADALDTLVIPFRDQVAAIAPQPDIVLPSGNARLAGFATPEQACTFALAALAIPGLEGQLRIAGHYALAHWLDAPSALVGRGVGELARLAGGALPGVLTVSETLASALFAGSDEGLTAEHIGERDGMRLFAVTRIARAKP